MIDVVLANINCDQSKCFFSLNRLASFFQSRSVMHRRMLHSNSPGSVIELADFPKRSNDLYGSSVSLNLQSLKTERMPRGHHIGEPIEFPALRSAFNRLSGLFTNQAVGTAFTPVNQEDTVTLATRVVADDEESWRCLSDSKLMRHLIEESHSRECKVPPYDLPWPMGQPEYSQVRIFRGYLLIS